MYGKYVLRNPGRDGEYNLEIIKPEESLWCAIFGEWMNCSIKYTIYRDLSQIVKELFDILSDQEVEVLKLRFGFYGEFCSLREVGRRMELSGERVRQIENKALRKMRNPYRSKCFLDVPKREDIMLVPDKTRDIKQVIVQKIVAYMTGLDSSVDFFVNILKRNELRIAFDSNFLSNVSLEEFELSVRACNCLKRSGVQSLLQLIDMTEEDIMKIRNLGVKCTKEVLERVRGYKPRVIEPIIRKMGDDTYTSVQVKIKGTERIYKFKRMSTCDMAECIYDILAGECSEYGTIVDYKMSLELKFLLLFKGYFFIEKMVEDSKQLIEELTAGMFLCYAEELKQLVKKIKDYIDNESNIETTFTVVKNHMAKKIICRNPQTRDELYKCFKTGNDKQNQEIKQSFMRHFPFNVKLDISNDISLRAVANDVELELDDEEIIAAIDLEEEEFKMIDLSTE